MTDETFPHEIWADLDHWIEGPAASDLRAQGYMKYIRADRIEELEAQVRAADALAEWVEGIIEDGCPLCGGDCSAANPPVAYCPQLEAMSDLAAYRATKEGGA